MRSKVKRGKDREDSIFDPLAELCKNNRGSKTRIAEKMTKEMNGETVHRQEVSQWLHPEKDKRLSPAFGAGMLLIECCQKEFNITCKLLD